MKHIEGVIHTFESNHAPLVLRIIIQQIRAIPIYGQPARDVCHPYITDIRRYT